MHWNQTSTMLENLSLYTYMGYCTPNTRRYIKLHIQNRGGHTHSLLQAAQRVAQTLCRQKSMFTHTTTFHQLFCDIMSYVASPTLKRISWHSTHVHTYTHIPHHQRQRWDRVYSTQIQSLSVLQVWGLQCKPVCMSVCVLKRFSGSQKDQTRTYVRA